MVDVGDAQRRRFADEFDEKVEFEGEEFGEFYRDDGFGDEKREEEDYGYNRSYVDAEESVVASSRGSRGRTDAESEGGSGADIKLSKQDEQRLLGAFLLAADGGLHGGESREDGGAEQEPMLSTDGPTCLKKFTTIAASLGLKTTREQLREDFEKVVRSNGLVDTSPGCSWQGAYDLDGAVKGFTYKVFKRYYLAKIQGELVEANIRQAWDDLHYGTGSKHIQEVPATQPNTPRDGDYTTANSAGSTNSSNSSSNSNSGRAYVTRAELHKILTREGEALTDEEVDELLRECRPDMDGRVVYEGYRRMLIDPSL